MCGIAGTTKYCIDFPDEILKSMRHRGPDAQGYFGELVHLFHARLSILDLDERANQPFWSNDKNIAVVFNGEIYNFLYLKEQLSQKYLFKTSSDTEVILYGYIEWGNKLWEKLDGMFAVSIYDKPNQKIILAKDHAGIKPLWYKSDSRGLSWASELRTLFLIEKQAGDSLALDLKNINHYLTFGYIPSPCSLFSEVYQLEASSYLEYELGTGNLNIYKYKNTVKSKIDSNESILGLVEDSVLSHLVADVPVGLFFSGGMDSSLIAAILRKHEKNLKAYSLSMPGRRIDQEFSNSIAHHLNLDIKFFEFNERAFQESYDDVVAKIDTPLADIAVFPGSFISKQAAREVKVVLSGEGGDELYFGYARHKILRGAKTNVYFRKILGEYLSFKNHKYKGFIFQKLSSKLDPVAYYIATCSPFFNILKKENILNAAEFFTNNNPLYYDRDLYLENMLLRKLDFVTMIHSIEGRVPLLSKVMFSESEQRQKSFDGITLKPEIKRVLLELLPEKLVERPKSGFGFRVEEFLTNNLKIKKDFEDAKEFLFSLGVDLSCLDYTRNQTTALPTILLYRSIVNVMK